MTNRKTLSHRAKVRIFDRHCGVCHLCGVQIDFLHETWEVSHVLSLWLNGVDNETNMKPAHVDCHSAHTRDEAPVRAKSDRVRARYLGAHKTRHPMHGWRKFDGTPVINPRRGTR